MPKGFKEVKFGDVLARADRFEKTEPLIEYQFAGTYSYGRGIFVSGKKMGSEFRLSRIQRIRFDDFVYCKIMAWEGAFGIVPIQADNSVMSGAFVVYEINQEEVFPKYLHFFFKTKENWQSIGRKSMGTNVRRRTLHPTQFEETRIILPSINEQKRTVSFVQDMSSITEKIINLNLVNLELCHKLRRAILHEAVSGKLVQQDPNDKPASELLKRIKEEKEKLIREKRIRKEKERPQISELKFPYKLPKGWEWVNLRQIEENSRNALKAGPFGSSLKKSCYVKSGYKIYGQEQVIKQDPK